MSKVRDSKYWIWIKITIGIVISAFFATCFMVVASHVGRDICLEEEDFQLVDYEMEDGYLTSTSSDSQLIRPHLFTYVNQIEIDLAETTNDDLDVTVYYSNRNHGYDETYAIKKTIKSGQDRVTLDVNSRVRSLRIDIDGQKQNASFKLDKVEINPDARLVDNYVGKNGDEFRLVFLVLFFISLHFIFDVNKMYEVIHRYRWGFAVLFLLFMVINEYNFSSIGCYNYFIQPGEGSDYVNPIIGYARAIRSDEWLIDTPRILSGQYNDFGQYNSIVMAKDTANLIASGLYRSYTALAIPENWGYYFLDVSHAFSFQWAMKYILTALFSYELFLIFTRKSKFVSLVGASLIVFSSFYQWWSCPALIWSMEAFLVFVYYFVVTDKKWKRILFGIGAAISGSRFVIALYPAWQVPMGYLVLIVFAWIMVSNWDKVKALDKKDWIILGCVVVFALSIIGFYLWNLRDYITAISQTAYPGKRVEYGGNSIKKLAYYIQAIKYSYDSSVAAPELGVFLSLFPIPTIGNIYCLIRNKKKDFLSIALLVYSLILTVYCTIGLPAAVCKITLLSYCTASRAVDILGLIELYMLIILLQPKRYEKKMPWYLAVPVSGVCIYWAIFETNTIYSFYCSKKFYLVMGCIYGIIGIVVLAKTSKRIRTVVLTGIILLSCITGATVHPVNKGLDAIYSKPVSAAIQNIVQKDSEAVWITTIADYGSSILIANGARTLNSVNYVPNMEFWEKFQDNETVEEEMYNRYARVNIELTTSDDTTLSLPYPDLLIFKLNYKDLEKTEANYILSDEKLESTENVEMKLLYDEYGCYIYHVAYK